MGQQTTVDPLLDQPRGVPPNRITRSKYPTHDNAGIDQTDQFDEHPPNVVRGPIPAHARSSVTGGRNEESTNE